VAEQRDLIREARVGDQRGQLFCIEVSWPPYRAVWVNRAAWLAERTYVRTPTGIRSWVELERVLGHG